MITLEYCTTYSENYVAYQPAKIDIGGKDIHRENGQPENWECNSDISKKRKYNYSGTRD